MVKEKRPNAIQSIEIDAEKRFKQINEMAIAIQDKSMSKDEIRSYAEGIELIADTNWVKSMNRAIDDVKKGNCIPVEQLMDKVSQSSSKGEVKK